MMIRNGYTFLYSTGKPPPSLTWWINYKEVDSTYHSEGSDKVVNKLKHMKAERYVYYANS